MATTWVGLENYHYVFNTDDTYQVALMNSIGQFLTELPIIVIVSLILALILNSNFKGRTFFRGVFFVPVIVAAGVIMGLLTQSYGENGPIIQLSSTVATDAYSVVGSGGGLDVTELLTSLELPAEITTQLNTMITDIFNTIWTCGIPVVLFIAGLQTIPAQLYEASKVEGATAWEEFWYITLPSIGQTLLLVIIFTLIELLTKADNEVINLAYEQIRNVEYGLSSAMLWLFFAIIGTITGLIILIFSKTCLKRWE
jgi:ABC-type sugar transport system permease subunit